jgi:hypothetical protein
MAGIEMQNVVLIALVLLIVIFVVYQYNPSFFRFMRGGEGFEDMKAKEEADKKAADEAKAKEEADKKAKEEADKKPKADGFENYEETETEEEPNMMVNTSGEGFANLSSYEGPAKFGSAEAPAGCYPRDQLTPSELLPKDMNSVWAEQNPMGPGSLKGKNFLSAGALIGVNTVGQSLRNANLQIRSEPPTPQVPVSIFLQSTIGPDISHRSLEIN